MEIALVTKLRRPPRRPGIKPNSRAAHLADIRLDERDDLVAK